jgi:hypothetical protein
MRLSRCIAISDARLMLIVAAWGSFTFSIDSPTAAADPDDGPNSAEDDPVSAVVSKSVSSGIQNAPGALGSEGVLRGSGGRI